MRWETSLNINHREGKLLSLKLREVLRARLGRGCVVGVGETRGLGTITLFKGVDKKGVRDEASTPYDQKDI